MSLVINESDPNGKMDGFGATHSYLLPHGPVIENLTAEGKEVWMKFQSLLEMMPPFLLPQNIQLVRQR